jgi:hypothetical protein
LSHFFVLSSFNSDEREEVEEEAGEEFAIIYESSEKPPKNSKFFESRKRVKGE